MIGLKKYISIPYIQCGEQFSGVDCMGLVSLFYREEFKKDVKNLVWHKKEKAAYGDVIVFCSSKHVGIVVDPIKKLMIHADYMKNVCIEKYSSGEIYGS